jgi:dTDP-4-amino-4,6-dideoxygalactose transaminase
LKVPLLDLKAQYQTIREEVRVALDLVLESQSFILGSEVSALEAEIAAYCDTRFAIGCASGSDALLLALMAVGVGPGDEVVCPAYTFFATGGSIARLGASPVYADIDPVSFNLDPASARSAALRCTRLKAFLPVHLFGQAADTDAHLALGREFGVPVIEDAAQAIGTRDAAGHAAGSRGAVGCFSFFPSKNLGAFGDAGIMTTQDPELADRLEILRVHGSRPKYFHRVVGINSRLDALQAAVLRVKLRHLDAWTKARQENAAWYDRAFAAAGAQPGDAPLDGSGLTLRTPMPVVAPARHIYNQYVIRVPAHLRDPLRQHLTEHGVGTEIYYPVCLHLQECFAYLGGREGDLPVSEAAARETLALPIYPELTREQQAYVVARVVEYVTDATSPDGPHGKASA